MRAGYSGEIPLPYTFILFRAFSYRRGFLVITELQSVTCHMWLHRVNCHLTQVDMHWLILIYLIHLLRRDGRLSWPWCLLYTEMVYPSIRQSPIQVATTW